MMTPLLALVTLSLVTLTLGATPWCRDLVSDLEDEGEDTWSAALNVPLTKDMDKVKFRDHWQMSIAFAKPISDMTVNSVQLSSATSDGLTSATFASTSLSGPTTWRQTDGRTVEVRQDTAVAPQSFRQQPAAVLKLDLSLQARGGAANNAVTSISCNGVQVCG